MKLGENHAINYLSLVGLIELIKVLLIKRVAGFIRHLNSVF
ncbi:hypothetical protein HMPREF9373_1242 [Psychrobacter sp. 1501(2011)]|nr:hypothetical protein HMPREF9373_1242 [Psychrobacter sp. 1501(2011)]